jgi:hypothetical protein
MNKHTRVYGCATASDVVLSGGTLKLESHKAVHEGKIPPAEARELERDRRPDGTGQASDGPGRSTETPRRSRTPRRCMCSCGGMTKGGRFLPGHDARLCSELIAQIKKGDVLLRSERITPEQRRYAVERGLAGPEVLPEE